MLNLMPSGIYIIYLSHGAKHAKAIFQSVMPFSNLMPSGTKFNYLFKSSNFAI